MNEEQTKWMAEMKAVIAYAESGTINFEAAIDRFEELMATYPEP